MSLHWIVAVLFLCLYVSVYYRQWFTEGKTPINWTVLQLHLSFGITVMVFVFLRLLYKFFDQKPDEVPGPWWEHWGAKIGHCALYAVMIIMPITGYFGTGVHTEFFGLFDIPQFKNTALYDLVVTGWMGVDWYTFEAPIDFVHKRGGEYLVWALILVHVGAALYHHFIKKDNTLRRMLPVKLR